MPTLNTNIPRFYCLLRKEFLYDGQAHQGEFVKVCAFGVASVYGRALGFHVLTENGAVIWRLPLHALCHKPEAPARPLDWLQIWDCFSYEVSCLVFERLEECRVRVQLKDQSWEGGQYMFTLDWYGHEDAEEAGDGGAQVRPPDRSGQRQLRGPAEQPPPVVLPGFCDSVQREAGLCNEHWGLEGRAGDRDDGRILLR